jgi:DNA-directed RNA polymerase specialized sigma24 family protein|tara:strand:- start:152 stop:658 length:507 start_codon:yes stop_codon:yes gene_type:complete
MVKKQMQLLFAKHSDWLDIVQSFGLEKTLSEDLVQEMYIKIQLKLEKGLDIRYKDDINYYYVFKTLRTMFLDLVRKTKGIRVIGLDQLADNIMANKPSLNTYQNEINYIEKYNIIKNELKKLYWYDRKIFEIINGGESIAELSRKTNIPYYSLYNTYKKVKTRLKSLL